MDGALTAFRKVNFDWASHIDEIWVDQPHDAKELQTEARRELTEALDDLMESRTSGSPLGVPLLGTAGSGKTHLLGFLRREALSRGMYFVLADMTDVSDFWETVSLGILRSLQQPLPDQRRQIDHWLDRLIEQYGNGLGKARDLPKQRPPGLINRTNELIQRIRDRHRAEVQEHADVLRALVLFACDHADINDLGYKWLQGLVLDDEELGVHGFRQRNQAPSRIVRGLSWLLSLTGPCVLALDQLDAIVAEHELAKAEASQEVPTEQARKSLAIIQGIAGGLLELRDLTRRCLTVVSSLEATWHILDRQASVSMADRFDSPLLLRTGAKPEVLRELVVGRLRTAYEAEGFTPPHPAYPFGPRFFEKYQDNTPRELLKACEAHRKACRRAGTVVEAGETPRPTERPPEPSWREELSRLIAERAQAADVDGLLSDESEKLQDKVVEAACAALLIENPVPAHVLACVDRDFMGTGSYDPLHARIRLVLSDQQERELHHSFRFLEKQDYRAFQARMKAALTASGVERALRFRGLTILRCRPVPKGDVSRQLVSELEARGGRIACPSREELALLMAIQSVLGSRDEPARFEEWLAAERPVSVLSCFAPAVEALFAPARSALGAPVLPAPAVSAAVQSAPVAAPPANAQGTPEPRPSAVSAHTTAARTATATAPVPTTALSGAATAAAPTALSGAGAPGAPSGTAAPSALSGFGAPGAANTPSGSGAPSASSGVNTPNAMSGMVPIGRRVSMGQADEVVGIPFDLLPYHTCVFGGSGSGKTVFLKRVVEEAALVGIPSIVVDVGNDLCRLGTPWPERPPALAEADVDKAQRYHASAEVVVWTPGAPTGNPMRLNPLPDFEPTATSPAEREAELQSAIEVAASSVGDMIIKQKSSATKQMSILKGTLRRFATQGRSLRELVAFLREPPDEVVSPFEKGGKLARELSELLHAEIENDPLLSSSGTPLDPQFLFRAQQPGKTRVSVLNLVGLPSLEQKRRFVDQLASTLFSWIKKHPAPAGKVLGLLVIDEAKEFVPSTKAVAGKDNLIRLAAQARKYGLGLLFATQEPKSIDHHIVANCTTLLAGKMSSPAAIDTLQQLLANRGAQVSDVATLAQGTFYFGPGSQKPRKVATALCMSHHPSTPPSEEQVLAIARASQAAFLR